MYDKLFKNNAPQPLRIPLIAVCGDDGVVTRIARRRGYASGLDDAQMAEAERIYTWARDLFVGQDITFFQSHNGIAPSPSLHVPHVMPGSPRLEDLELSAEDREKIARTFGMPYERIAEFFNVPFKSAMTQPSASFLQSKANFYQTSGDVDFLKIDGMRFVVLDDIDPHAIAEAMLTAPGILDLLRVDLLDIEARTGKPQEVNIELRVDTSGVTDPLDAIIKAMDINPVWLREVPMRKPNGGRYTGKLNPGQPPKVDSYWQSRTEPTKFYRITDVQPCLGHSHIEMHCLQDGEPDDDRVWISSVQWADLFTEVDRTTALAPLSPQSMRGPYTEHFDPAVLEARDAAQPVIDATQQMLDYVPFKGTEAPPKPGEQYQRIDSDHVYTVVDATPGDMGVVTITMDSHKGGVFYGRQKHAFRNHAQWLAKWRPVGSDGNVKPVEFVDLEEFVDAALEGDDKEAFAEVREGILHEDGNAVRWIGIIGRELDRRVPGWRDFDPPGVLYDDCALILRAIRTLNRHMLNYQKFADELRERTNALVADAQRDQKRLTELTTWINEMSRDATVSFKNTFGIEKAKGLLKEFGYANVMSIPLADRVSWVRKLREYTGMAGEL